MFRQREKDPRWDRMMPPTLQHQLADSAGTSPMLPRAPVRLSCGMPALPLGVPAAAQWRGAAGLPTLACCSPVALLLTTCFLFLTPSHMPCDLTLVT
jgi:hypothetical protein